jgi:DNA adenine methylase
MRYYGGKGVVGKQISKIILYLFNDPNAIYIEPFCGALGVLRHVSTYYKKCYANDLSKDLIMLHKSVKGGKFENPRINKEKWLEYKYSSKTSAGRAFAGHGCSYGGVWFNGYIDDPTNNDMIYSSLVRIAPKIQNTIFFNKTYIDFLDDFPFEKGQSYVIYLDPPYGGTCNLPFEKKEKFDTDRFWETARKLSKMKNVKIIVSEVSAPSDFKCVYKFKRRNGMHNISDKTVIEEKLYIR